VSIHTAGRVRRFSRYYAHGQWFESRVELFIVN